MFFEFELVGDGFLRFFPIIDKVFLKSNKKEDNMSGYFVHESSYADEGCQIGEGTKIWHFSHVQPGAIIGKNCSIGQNVNVACTAILGDNCKIQNNVSIYDNVELEDGVFCGPSMVFTNVINPRAFIERKHEYKKTLLKKGVTVGANATIVCGNTLGEYCMIGSGAVVTHNVPPYALSFGSPARVKGWICKCGVKLSDTTFEGTAECSACGLAYQITNEKCTPKRIDEDA